MFNHKIIFRFFSLVFIAGIFFGLSEAACTPGVGVRAGYGVAGYGSMPTTCQFGTPGTPSRFNNTKSYLEGNNNFKYLVNVYGLTINDNCYSNDTLVFQIQTKLVNISSSCITCIDGKFGGHTQFIVNNTSCRPTCAPGNQPNTDGLCNPGYTPDTVNGCCLPPDCSEGEKLPQNSVGGCDDPGFVSDGAGCCIPDCQDPKKPANTPDCSDLDGYTYENGCCILPPPGNPNIQQRETDCNLTPGTLNTTTVSCINLQGNSCCADPTCRPTGEQRPSNLPDCDMNIVDRENDCGLTPGTLNATTVSCINLQGNSCCIDTGCRPQLEPKPGLVDCSAETLNPNTCTADGQIGILSGTSRVCKDCPTGEKPNSGHTQCVCDPANGCCGIQLNTVVPFIGDCIQMSNDESAGNTTRVNALNAFPILMGSLSKMLVTAILIFSFVMVVIGGVLITAGGINPDNFKKGKDIIGKVIVGLALLGASGIILRLINPNFFG